MQNVKKNFCHPCHRAQQANKPGSGFGAGGRSLLPAVKQCENEHICPVGAIICRRPVPAILKREPPTLAGPLVGQQLVALLAAALEAAHRVPAHVVTSAVVEAALVDVCGQKSYWEQK